MENPGDFRKYGGYVTVNEINVEILAEGPESK
jgi:hypothetical protein